MDKENGYILIGTVSAILLIFLLGFLTILLIYRKRKLEHYKELEIINERFANQILQTQLEVQQQTMQYIGREIHDNVGQQLTLAALYTQQIDYEKKYPQIEDRIIAVSKIINESLAELRNLSKDLTSDYIAQTDLVALVKNECEKIRQAKFCSVTFSCDLIAVNASYPVKNITLRIVQEFLQNSLKHSGCSAIDARIDKANDDIIIYTQDNGRGFSEHDLPEKGIGLINMKKRAEVIGADIIIDSSKRTGTKMRLRIPADKINS